MKTRERPSEAGSPVTATSGRAVQPGQGTIDVEWTVRSHERPSAENQVVNGGSSLAAFPDVPHARYPPASLRMPSMLPPDPGGMGPSLVHASGGPPDGGAGVASAVASDVGIGVATGSDEGVDEGVDEGDTGAVPAGDDGTTIEGSTAPTEGAGGAEDCGSEVHAATRAAAR